MFVILMAKLAEKDSMEKRKVLLRAKKLAVVLDLDQTLLHAEECPFMLEDTETLDTDIPELKYFATEDGCRFVVKFRSVACAFQNSSLKFDSPFVL
jgi:hypothetical protein